MNTQGFEIIGDGEVVIGQMTTIAAGAKVVFHKPGKVIVGDYCNIGPGVKIVMAGGVVSIGDWTSLHDNCLVLSAAGVQIGEHCWFGQGAVLDGTGGLTVGNGVRVGMYSQLWSHVAAGERIEGCTLYGERPVIIEDDVWLVGSCICASGITIGRRVVALIGSNITRSWPENVVLAGSPAQPKEGLTFYRDVSIDEKWLMLKNWMSELELSLGLARIDVGDDGLLGYRWADESSSDVILFALDAERDGSAINQFADATVCNVTTKHYRKKLTGLEQTVLKALAGNKARFVNAGNKGAGLSLPSTA